MVEPTFELVWGPPGGVESPSAEHAPISDVGELERRLDGLEATARAGEPLVAELVDPERGTLGVGLGREQSVAYFHRADGEPPYLLSRGDGDPVEQDP